MEKIINELLKFGFTKMDGQVYLALLKNPDINGSQIAKILNVPRASVYASLNTLYQNGAVYLLPGESNLYRGKNPVVLIKELKKSYIESAEYLEKEFENFGNEGEEAHYWNIKGYQSFITKVKELIAESEKEIYINTNIDLGELKEEIREAGERGVRIILFSFDNHCVENLPVEFYYNSKLGECKNDYMRMIIVCDFKKGLIASGRKNEEIIGTFTDNTLFVQLLSEHIHHDIYLMKIEKKYGSDWFEEMKLGTIQENGFARAVCGEKK